MLQNLREESKALIKNPALALVGIERECRSKHLPQRVESNLFTLWDVVSQIFVISYEWEHCMRELFFSLTTTL